MEKDEINKMIFLYIDEKFSLRDIAKEFNTNHKKISKILRENGIVIKRSNKKIVISKEHRDKISIKMKELYLSGKKEPFGANPTKENLYKNMSYHLKYDVDLEWLMSFEDFEKLKFLNRSIGRQRDCKGFDIKLYMEYIEKFYYEENFNRLYNKWKRTNDNNMKPSLDHIIPKSKGCDLKNLDNLRFLTWFENRAKTNIDEEEWTKIKMNINEYF
jgi:predicted DNA-binding protein YlxM (UPF0122 family)